MDRITAKSPRFPYDMGAWCAEKSKYVVEELAQHVDELKALQKAGSLPDSADLHFLDCALFDATKLFAFFWGQDWSPADKDPIMDRGYEGYEELAVRYGLLEKTTHRSSIDQIKDLISKARRFLSGPRSPNRTELHILFSQNSRFMRGALAKIADSLEQVTFGTKDWVSFSGNALEMLETIGESEIEQLSRSA